MGLDHTFDFATTQPLDPPIVACLHGLCREKMAMELWQPVSGAPLPIATTSKFSGEAVAPCAVSQDSTARLAGHRHTFEQ